MTRSCAAAQSEQRQSSAATAAPLENWNSFFTSTPRQLCVQKQIRLRRAPAVEEVGRGQINFHHARLKVNHPACQALGLAQIVGAHHQGHAFARKALQQGLDLVFCVRVEVGGGLVQEQNLRLHCPCARQSQTLLLPARQSAGAALMQVHQAHTRQCLLRQFSALRTRNTRQPQGNAQIVQHRQVQEERFLEHHRLALRRGTDFSLTSVSQQVMQQAQQRGFA